MRHFESDGRERQVAGAGGENGESYETRVLTGSFSSLPISWRRRTAASLCTDSPDWTVSMSTSVASSALPSGTGFRQALWPRTPHCQGRPQLRGASVEEDREADRSLIHDKGGCRPVLLRSPPRFLCR